MALLFALLPLTGCGQGNRSTPGEGMMSQSEAGTVASAHDAPATAPSAVAGRYLSETLTVDLSDAAAGGYAGTVILGGQMFPLTATGDGKRLEGSYDANGQAVPFTATVADHTMTFTAGGTSYTLHRLVKHPEPVRPKTASPLSGDESGARSR
jgi:hypothetical protein